MILFFEIESAFYLSEKINKIKIALTGDLLWFVSVFVVVVVND